MRAAPPAPAAPVSIAKCGSYGAELVPTLDRMFDQLGGLGRLVSGKTVAIKINLTGAPSYRVGYLPCEDTHYTHPRVIGAVCYLMSRAGARRIRLLESPWASADPIEEYLLQANWEPLDILNAAPRVEFENTNFLGNSKRYVRLKAPNGGLMFPAFDLNHSYADCDVFVSLAKMKEHATAGVTLSMKNCFGITPATIYGTGAGIEEPSILPKGGRTIVHSGARQPSKSAPGELHPGSPREDTYRVPRTIVDLVSARPIDLAVLDGIRTMTGGEGPWIREKLTGVRPGVLLAGTNCVNVDAAAMAVMGFDPLAVWGTPPFERCDSTLHLAEDAGVGSRDLKRIDILGTPVREALFDFAAIRRERRAARERVG
ncbi:MAG: DUF362 domain-containing protein [Acidobacteriota bacterium]